ncbi:MAG: S8 family serine peptidase [bacterium]|nr:S8 family serine peptidase [bacterium]
MKKKSPLYLLSVGLLLALVLPVAALAAAPVPVPGRILVTFEPGTTPVATPAIDGKAAGGLRTGLPALDAVLAGHRATALEPLFAGNKGTLKDAAVRREFARHYLLLHDDLDRNNEIMAALRALPYVTTVEQDLLLESHGTAFLPNDLTNQWHLRNMSVGGGDTRAVGGWSESLGDSNVVVAVLDTGVDWHHPDLGGPHPDKVNGALWTNWEEYYGTAMVDDDGNGFVDDIRGWDFVNVAASQVMPGEDATPADNDPMDFNGHGTLVSGCIAPLTNNGVGIAAIAPGCKVMAIRIGYMTTDGNGVSFASLMASGFMYAVNNDADIINLSYGTGFTTAFANAINAALNAGLVICVSAGNDNDEVAGYLQGLADDRILAVAATGSGDARASFSSYGTWVDVAAPGEGINTTAYHYTSGTSTYEATQGTSFSSPITAGACALIWSAHPEYTASQVAALIQSSADPIDAINPGFEGKLGSGRVNLLKALGDNVHQYPQEFPSMFDAMNGAAAGDTVKVLGSAVVTSPFTVFGKGLKVFGGYDASYTTRDLVGGHTLISGGSGVQLTFAGNITQSTEVDGFEITGGTGQNMTIVAPNTRCAGGVLVNLVSPILRNLKIHGNTVGSGSQLGCGGGVLLANSSALLENCEIFGNTGVYGAGVFASGGAPTFINCTITDNVLLTSNATYSPRGGGFYAHGANPYLSGCTVSGHADADLGGGIYAGGAGVMSAMTVENCTVSGNTAKTGGGGMYQTGGSLNADGTSFVGNDKTAASTFMFGGGLQATGGTLATLSNLVVSGNQAQVGGGIALVGCTDATLSNSVINGNSGMFWGGGVHYDNCPNSGITGNTIYGNTGGAGGGGAYVANCSPAISNNISAGNIGGPSFGNGFALVGSSSAPTCNDVFGNQNSGWTGIADPTGTGGNIAVDPLFCDAAGGNFQLQTASLCRPENNGACGQIGALLGSCVASPVPGDDGALPLAFRVDQNFPNPFNPKTTIRFALPAAARTTVNIFDVAGRHVKTLLDEELGAQSHDVVWTGDDNAGQPVAAGVYFYEVSGGGHRAVGRMALVK